MCSRSFTILQVYLRVSFMQILRKSYWVLLSAWRGLVCAGLCACVHAAATTFSLFVVLSQFSGSFLIHSQTICS